MLTLLLSLSVVNGYVLRSIRLPRAASPATMAESPTFFAKLFNKDEAPAVGTISPGIESKRIVIPAPYKALDLKPAAPVAAPQ